MMKVLTTAIALFFTTQGFASEWPEIDFPKSSQVEVVADSMRYHGYPMKTWVLKDKQSQMMMANFFKQQWLDSSDRFDARMFNGDYVINSLQDPYLLTARINQTYDGVIAYIGITKNISDSELNKATATRFPKLPQTVVMSDIQSTDIYKQGRTLVMNNSQSLSANYHYYRRHFQQKGWIENSAMLDTLSGKAVLQMSQGTDLIDICFNRKESKTYIVANQVKEGL